MFSFLEEFFGFKFDASILPTGLLAQPMRHEPITDQRAESRKQQALAETTKVVEPKSASLSCSQSLRGTSAGAAITGMAASAGEAAGATTPEAPSPFSDDWKERIIFPAAGAGEPSLVATLFYVSWSWS